MIFDLLKDLNTDCNFTDKINESIYIQNSSNSLNSTNSSNSSNIQQNDNSYNSFKKCIISEFDPLYLTLPDNEKSIYMNKLIIELCSEIDENSQKYDNYNYNNRYIKKSIIQYSLQNKYDLISSIYYLNDYYKKHFVIVYENKLYKTCIKNYPIFYLTYNNHKITISESSDIIEYDDINKLFSLIPLKDDINKSLLNIYKMPLNPIGSYKIDELKQMANEYKISLKNGTKNKVKKDLYEEINLYKLNH